MLHGSLRELLQIYLSLSVLSNLSNGKSKVNLTFFTNQNEGGNKMTDHISAIGHLDI